MTFSCKNFANIAELLPSGWEARAQKEWPPLYAPGGWELVRVQNSNQPSRTGTAWGSRATKLPGVERQEGQRVALCGFAGSHTPRASKFGFFPAGSATGKVLRRNLLSPPHNISFKGSQWQTAPAHRDDRSVQKHFHYESGDLLETNYQVASESKTRHFPKAFPRTALTFGGAAGQLHFF